MAADYKIVNIKELEDMAVKFGLSPNVEARFGRSATDAKQGGFSYQKLAPDYRQPYLKPFDVVRVAPKVARGFESGPDGLEFLAFGAGESGDAEMLESFWEDAAIG